MHVFIVYPLGLDDVALKLYHSILEYFRVYNDIKILLLAQVTMIKKKIKN